MAIEIPVVAKTDKFEKQLKEIDNRLAQTNDKDISINFDIVDLERQKRNVQTWLDSLKEAENELEKLRTAEPNTEIGPKGDWARELHAGALANMQQIVEQLKAELAEMPGIEELDARIREVNELLHKSTEGAGKLDAKMEEVDARKLKEDLKEAQSNMSNVGSSIQGVISKVGRLALSVIGIGSAISMLRSASSQLAQYDEGYAAKLEYIRFALAQAIAPVLQWIVNMAGTVLALINAIIHSLTGINIFANAGKKAFENMKNSTKAVKNNVGGAAKGVAEMKKQLMGFDEVNVLQANGSVGGGGGGRRR